jgi:hypothetical protein
VQRFGLGMAPLVVVELSEVFKRGANIRVIGAERLL